MHSSIHTRMHAQHRSLAPPPTPLAPPRCVDYPMLALKESLGDRLQFASNDYVRQGSLSRSDLPYSNINTTCLPYSSRNSTTSPNALFLKNAGRSRLMIRGSFTSVDGMPTGQLCQAKGAQVPGDSYSSDQLLGRRYSSFIGSALCVRSLVWCSCRLPVWMRMRE